MSAIQKLQEKAIVTGHAEPSVQSLMAEIEMLKAEKAKLAANKGSSIKVSPKGAISLYGFGKWPVTLYRSQWEKLFSRVDEIKAFIVAHESMLTNKAES